MTLTEQPVASSIAFKCSSVISPPQPKACCKELQKTHSITFQCSQCQQATYLCHPACRKSFYILIMSLCLYHSISISTSSVYLYVIYCCIILYHTKIYIHTLTTCTSSMASRICDLKLAASTLAASAAPTEHRPSMLFKLLKTTGHDWNMEHMQIEWMDKSVPGYSKGMFLHGALRMDPKDQAQ